MAWSLPNGKQIQIIHRVLPADFRMSSLKVANDHYSLNYHIRGDRKIITPAMTYISHPGYVSALAPYVYYRTIPASAEQYENIQIKFSPAFVKYLTGTFGEQILEQVYDCPTNHFEAKAQESISKLFFDMLDVYDNPTDYSDFKLECMLSQLLITIMEERLPEDDNARIHQSPLTPQIIEAVYYIEEHFSEDLKIETAAGISGYSVSYFSKLFSDQVGKSFSEYLSRVRVKKVQELLLNTSMSVTDIAIETGYQYPGNMTAAFKHLTGMTPNQYRRINVKP